MYQPCKSIVTAVGRLRFAKTILGWDPSKRIRRSSPRPVARFESVQNINLSKNRKKYESVKSGNLARQRFVSPAVNVPIKMSQNDGATSGGATIETPYILVLGFVPKIDKSFELPMQRYK